MSRVLNGENQITQKYKSLTHKGIDLVKYKAQTCEIIAHSDGVVVEIVKTYTKTDKTGSSYGNYIVIDHENGYWTNYAHLKHGSISLKKGDRVVQGQPIAYMGNTGRSSGSHLHFEVRKGKNSTSNRIDPTPYIDADLPKTNCVTYSVYDRRKAKWLPSVTSGTLDYAGNKGNPISGLKISNYTYQVHDKIKGKWLPVVTGDSDYAGNLPNDIDGVRIFGSKGYRVYDNVKKKWLPYVYVDSEYAGNFGNSIGGVQIK